MPQLTFALRILLVDDEPDAYLAIGELLRDKGHEIVMANNGEDALALVKSSAFDIMVCDVRLPKLDGLALFRSARQESPDMAIILATAYGQVADAIAAVKEGASDYLTKPLDADEMMVRIDRIGERIMLERQLEDARTQLAKLDPKDPIIGRSTVMCRLQDRVNTIAASHASVLVLGESGTGKELIARALHERGTRRNKAFVTVNCAAFPDTLLEAELFGHERGAFTGAVSRREGRFRAAHGGTLLLDEVADMSPAAQAKLLRVLQEGTIEPLGTNDTVRVDVRVISATHRNLREMIAAGTFREDLYYRLNVLSIDVPALRDRKGDLPLLVQYFLNKHRRPDRPAHRLSLRAWTALSEHRFPGNVRQLGHAIERAVLMAGDAEIDVHHLPRDIHARPKSPTAPAHDMSTLSVAIKAFERSCLQSAMSAAEGKRIRAAELLGISRKNLWEKLRMHGDL
jgi:two-component system response regulator AtoC